MISQAIEYSLRAMVLLTQSANGPLKVRTIATRGQIPAPYLAKLLQGLTRAGLITSKRGIGGGFFLARRPAEITLAEIANVVEPFQRITKCPFGIDGHFTLCPLHHWLDQVLAKIEQAFLETTLEELCQDDGSPIRLCSLRSKVATDAESVQRG